MGCFSVFLCYTSSKHPKLNNSVNKATSFSSANQAYVKNREIVLIGSLQAPISKSRVNSEDQAINADLEANTEHVYVKSEDKEKNVKEESTKLGVLVQLENAKERDDEKKNGNGKLGVLVQIDIENERKEAKQNNLGVYVEINNESGAISDSSVSSYISYPPMHRYHNCGTDEDDEHLLIQEDSPESLFSLSIDPTRQSKSSPVEVDNKEVNSPLKPTSSPELVKNNDNESNDLLNPVENLAQRRTMKARHQEKENLYPEHEEISKVSDQKQKLKTDTVVATSLSSWLVDPEKSTVSKKESQYSRGSEDRPILGAWSIDEVKQISARSSPRKSPCTNLDDTPITGTVGSYLSHTGQTTDSSNSCTSPLGICKIHKEQKGIIDS